MSYQTLKKLYYGDETVYINEYIARFNSEDAVKIDFTIGEKQAFFLENKEVLQLVIAILRLDKEASALCAALPGIAKEQYAKKCLIDEIVLTNKIEGVHSSRRDIFEALDTLEQQSEAKGKRKRFDSLVKTYLLLMEEQSLTLKTSLDVRRIYDRALLEEVVIEDSSHAPDGEIFRKDLTEIHTPTGKVIHQGIFPEKKIIEAMEKALAFFNDESVDALYRICIFHYFVEYIHPFYDGNGRLGRLLLSFGLSEQLEPLVGFKISETIREHLKAYYEAFQICNDSRNLGDLTPFLLMLLTMIKEALKELNQSLTEKLLSWGKYKTMIQSFDIPKDKNGNNIKKMYHILVQAALFSENGISTEELTHIFTSYHHMTTTLKSIPENQILVQKKGRRKCYQLNLNVLDEIFFQDLQKKVEISQ